MKPIPRARAAAPAAPRTPLLVSALVVTSLALAACGGDSDHYIFIEPAEIEPIEGSEVNRVTLTADAAVRLGVATVLVRSEVAARQRQFGAEVVDRPTGADGGSALWLRLVLTDSERDAFDVQEGGVLFSLNGDSGVDGLQAEMVDGVEGAEEPLGGLFFAVPRGPDVLAGTPLLIELHTVSAERLVIPYSSVVYDPQGQTWVYTNPEPLVYQRHPISIEYIDGDDAILLEGPPAGTEVVAIGVGELSGFEAGVGR